MAAFLFFLFFQSPSDASWLLDREKFHVSVHGQTPCQDCHEDAADRGLHPDPSDVSKSEGHFFSMDQCLACHDHIEEDLDQGLHGETKIEDSEDYTNCLECHNPHDQLLLDENELGPFDPKKPIREQCGTCHDKQTALPAFSDDDAACMFCHRLPGRGETGTEVEIDSLCLHCHAMGSTRAQIMTGEKVSPVDIAAYQSVEHSEIGCTACHSEAARFRHSDQGRVTCDECHPRHDEKVAHDAHMNVACEACHLKGVQGLRDPESQFVSWERKGGGKKRGDIHHLGLAKDESSCGRCHFKGNRIGAASMVLPAKGLLCMPCHASTLTLKEPFTIFALIIFLAGAVSIFSFMCSGAFSPIKGKGTPGRIPELLKRGGRAVFSSRLWPILKVVILDVFLQRRLYHRSAVRWFIHSLIFMPFLFRFVWGLAGLIGSLWAPAYPPVWALLDKNHPATAFLFDLSGMMIVLGIFLVLIRRLGKETGGLQGLPKQGLSAPVLIAGILLVGFVLEAIRIAMTGYPSGASYAFIGYGLSSLFSGSKGITEIYGYVWYAHAILTGIFIAYLPFSRLFHIIISPIVLALNAMSERH